jgi:uncharacterized protein (TIRG00374 family)
LQRALAGAEFTLIPGRANVNKNDSNSVEPKRKTSRLAIRIVVLIVLVGGFAVYFTRHRELLPDWELIRWNYFYWIIFLSIVANLAASMAYQALVLHLHPSLCGKEVIRIFIIGRTLNLISPQAGTLYSAISMKAGGYSYTKYSATMAASLWLDITLATAAAIAALSFVQNSHDADALLLVFCLVLLLSLFAGIVLLKGYRHRLLERFVFSRGRIGQRLSELTEMLNGIIRNTRVCLIFSLWSVANALVHGFRLYLCFAMLQAVIDLPYALACTVLVKASNTISITPGNFGIVEGIVGLMGSQIGISLGVAVLAGLVYRLGSYIALFLMSLFLNFRKA